VTSTWQNHDLDTKVQEVLADVPVPPQGHAFGRPYLSAYQVAIGLRHKHRDTVDAIGKPLGGKGTGQQDSLTQYLANELSKRIKADPAYPVEGAFLSNQRAREISFETHDGQILVSSLVGTQFDLSLFRLR
jgi:hypothetical protein